MAIGNLYEFVIDMELDRIRDYIATMETALRKEFETLKAGFEAKLKEISSEDDADDANTLFNSHARELLEDFPALCYRSTFVTTYSFFESELFHVCDYLQSKRSLTLSVRDIAGKGIDQARTYFAKVIGVQFPTGTQEWQTIRKLQRVRNAIVHLGGQLAIPRDGTDRHAEIRKCVNGLPGAKVDNTSQIVLSQEFCQYAIETVRGFLKKLNEAVPNP